MPCKHKPCLGSREDGCKGSPIRARLGEAVSSLAVPSEGGGTDVGTGLGTLWCPFD